MADLGITLEIAAARLTAYLDAEKGVLGSQSYRFADGRELTRADLREIREGINYWQGHVDRLNPTPTVLPTPRAVGHMRRGSYRIR
ncbi:DUF6148 family protein [Sphingomonas dokdonensis]|uniref:Uncharacterized protein n=1 Tax=Sphingomonas dokdonensis TaxID=344880 RepID=A0A245ZHH8_9SPHN|nr:DUF6148 family protein [Sphingomonas dokdonensis]OWK29199.1 hypothetical protein SPDO_21800 [Sphingomonas dokdonensis]